MVHSCIEEVYSYQCDKLMFQSVWQIGHMPDFGPMYRIKLIENLIYVALIYFILISKCARFWLNLFRIPLKHSKQKSVSASVPLSKVPESIAEVKSIFIVLVRLYGPREF